MCDYCGIKWYRSECRRDATGWLSCPDCQDDGKDLMTMERERAAAAAEPAAHPTPDDWR